MEVIDDSELFFAILHDHLLLAQITIMFSKLEAGKSCYFFIHSLTAFSTSVIALCHEWFESVNLVKTVRTVDLHFYVSCLGLLSRVPRDAILLFLKGACHKFLIHSREFWTKSFEKLSFLRSKEMKKSPQNFAEAYSLRIEIEATGFLPSLFSSTEIVDYCEGYFLKHLNSWYFGIYSNYAYELKFVLIFAQQSASLKNKEQDNSVEKYLTKYKLESKSNKAAKPATGFVPKVQLTKSNYYAPTTP